MRFIQPTRATQLNTQASWACSGTIDWLKMICLPPSTPAARKAAAISRVCAAISVGSCGWVIACMSTTQYRHSKSFCRRAKLRIAPR